ncbi:unnamed protein product, partial [Polarella glacialis]
AKRLASNVLPEPTSGVRCEAIVPVPSRTPTVLGPHPGGAAPYTTPRAAFGAQQPALLALPAPPDSPTPDPVSAPNRRARRRAPEESAEEAAKAAKAARADAEDRQLRIRQLQEELEQKRRDCEHAKAQREAAHGSARKRFSKSEDGAEEQHVQAQRQTELMQDKLQAARREKLRHAATASAVPPSSGRNTSSSE